MTFFTADFLNFFKELAANNNKDWFDAHRSRYVNSVREPFRKFVETVIIELASFDVSFKELEAKECIFRINRDIRFSKDKSPYKLFVSAIISPDGKRSKGASGIYIEFGPEHVRIYGGLYAPEKDVVYAVRDQICGNLKEFQKLCNQNEFQEYFGRVLGEKNKILPAEWRSEAEKEPLIFNKQWYFYNEELPEFILSDNLLDWVLNGNRIAKPMIDFLNKNSEL